MPFVRTVLLIAVLLLGWAALRAGLNPSAAANHVAALPSLQSAAPAYPSP